MPGLADSLLALACIAIVPWLLGRAIAPGIGWPARAWCGAVLAGAIVMSGHALRVPPVPTLGAAVLAGILSLLVSSRRLLAVLVVLLALPAAGAIVLALHVPVPEGDGLVLWFAKTRGAFFWDALSRGQLPAYPALGPVLWMLPLRVVGLGYENLGRALPALIWLAWGIGLLGVAGRPWDVPALAGAALAAMLPFDPVGLTNGYQDLLLLLTVGFAASTMVRLLLRDREPPTRSELLATGILAGAAALVKQEGMVWSLILGVTFLVALVGLVWSLVLGVTFLVALLGRSTGGGRRGPGPWVAPFVVAWVATSALWPALLRWNGISLALQEDAFTTGSVLGALLQLDRWGTIRPFFGSYFLGRGPLLLAGLVASVSAAAFTPACRRVVGFLWAVLALHLAFVGVVFLSTRLDLAWHLQTAFHRLAGQGDVVYSLLILVGTVALGREVSGRMHLKV
jgi:hypothetical protein